MIHFKKFKLLSKLQYGSAVVPLQGPCRFSINERMARHDAGDGREAGADCGDAEAQAALARAREEVDCVQRRRRSRRGKGGAPRAAGADEPGRLGGRCGGGR